MQGNVKQKNKSVVRLAFILSFVLNGLPLYAETCEADLYKNCYKGVPWGTEIDDAVADKLGCVSKQDTTYFGATPRLTSRAKKFNLLTSYNYYDILMPVVIEEELVEKIINKYKNDKCPSCLNTNIPFAMNGKRVYGSSEFPDIDSCNTIIFQNKLVGFWFSSNPASDEDYLFIKGTMKKKYGKNFVETKGANWTEGSVKWADVNGLNISLIRRKNDKVSIQYIKLDVLNNLLTLLDEKTAKDKENSNAEEIKKKNDIVKGL